MVQACSSISKDECLAGDWYSLGVTDGKAGTLASKFREYQKDCADHGVAPDLNAYRLGHSEGSAVFCTSRSGFNVGKRGGSYQQSCSAALEEDFLAGYRDGKTLYDLQRALKQANSAVEKQQRLLTRLEQDITAKTELLVEDGLVKEERIQLLDDIEALKLELVAATDLLPALQQDVRRAQTLYQQAERRFSFYQ